jgi:hypothetical protein
MKPEAVARLRAFFEERKQIRAGLSATARVNIEARWSAVYGPDGPWEQCIAALESMGTSRHDAITYIYAHPEIEEVP